MQTIFLHVLRNVRRVSDAIIKILAEIIPQHKPVGMSQEQRIILTISILLSLAKWPQEIRHIAKSCLWY